MDHYTWALRLNPVDADVYNSRGNAYSSMGQHMRAVEDYDAALSNNPQLTEAAISRGKARIQLGEHEKAVEDLNEALRLLL